MLYRKTTKAVSAAILTVMALLGVNAHAVIDLDATTAAALGAVVFSKETLGNFSPGTAPAQQFHNLYVDEERAPSACNAPSSTATSTRLAVKTAVGMRIPAEGTRYVRLDLTNMRFRVALDSTALGVCLTGARTGAAFAIEAGGGVNDTRVILAVTNNTSAALPVSEPLYFALHGNLAIKTGATVGGFTYGAYADLGSANEQRAPLKTTARNGIFVASSVTVRVAPGVPAVADVAVNPRFTDFVGGGRKPLGKVTVTLNKTHLRAVQNGGLVATLAHVRRSGVARFTTPGGLGFGTFTMHAADDCSGTGAPVAVEARGENVGRGSVSLVEGERTLCVARRLHDHDEDRTTDPVPMVIPETTIAAATAFTANTTAQFAPAALAATTIGSIERNGTTVRLPFLTTFDAYNHRIIIVNRGNVAADYELTFTTEDGVTATPGHMAEDTVAANSTKVIRVGDAVTLVGGNRTAATLAVVAPNHLIDVATTIVTLEDKSTDTVTYDAN